MAKRIPKKGKGGGKKEMWQTHLSLNRCMRCAKAKRVLWHKKTAEKAMQDSRQQEQKSPSKERKLCKEIEFSVDEKCPRRHWGGSDKINSQDEDVLDEMTKGSPNESKKTICDPVEIPETLCYNKYIVFFLLDPLCFRSDSCYFASLPLRFHCVVDLLFNKYSYALQKNKIEADH